MTLYTSDTDISKAALRTAFAYLLISLICALFGAVYEVFSHEVYSFFMIYAFAFPLAGGTLPFLALSLFRAKRYPGCVARNLYHSGISTLTAGSIIRGVLDIYGTTNALTGCYWLFGTMLLIGGIIVFFLQKIADVNRLRQQSNSEVM